MNIEMFKNLSPGLEASRHNVNGRVKVVVLHLAGECGWRVESTRRTEEKAVAAAKRLVLLRLARVDFQQSHSAPIL